MAADGTQQRNVTQTANGNESSPDWSPDGTTLLFSWSDSTSNGDRLGQIKPDGSGRLNLGNSELWGISAPRWAPDGASILFGMHKDVRPHGSGSIGQSSLYGMNADGSGVTRLVELRDDPGSPGEVSDWQPLPGSISDGQLIGSVTVDTPWNGLLGDACAVVWDESISVLSDLWYRLVTNEIRENGICGSQSCGSILVCASCR